MSVTLSVALVCDSDNTYPSSPLYIRNGVTRPQNVVLEFAAPERQIEVSFASLETAYLTLKHERSK